jgi:biotin carboxyl carrier protein
VAEIRAPIPGNVFKLLVAAGDRVEDGTVVALIESMKLEIPVESEVSGTIGEVHVAEGDSVGEDDVLFTVA